MVYVRSVFRKSSIEAMAEDLYGDPELAAEFMDNGHRGEIAKFVLGDEDAYVFPRDLTQAQQEKLKEYLEAARYRQPAKVVAPSL